MGSLLHGLQSENGRNRPLANRGIGVIDIFRHLKGGDEFAFLSPVFAEMLERRASQNESKGGKEMNMKKS